MQRSIEWTRDVDKCVRLRLTSSKLSVNVIMDAKHFPIVRTRVLSMHYRLAMESSLTCFYRSKSVSLCRIRSSCIGDDSISFSVFVRPEDLFLTRSYRPKIVLQPVVLIYIIEDKVLVKIRDYLESIKHLYLRLLYAIRNCPG